MKKQLPKIILPKEAKPTGQHYAAWSGKTAGDVRQWASEAKETPCNVTKSPAIILSGTLANLTSDAEGVATFNLTNGKNMSGAIQLHTADLPEWFENGAMITLDTGAMTIRLHKIPTPAVGDECEVLGVACDVIAVDAEEKTFHARSEDGQMIYGGNKGMPFSDFKPINNQPTP